MLNKPLTHLVILLALVALWFGASAKDSSLAVDGLAPSGPNPAGSQPQGRNDNPGRVELDLPPDGVSVLEELGSTALLHIDMAKHKRMTIALEFSGPSVGWSFNLGDSNTNNGWGGDSSTAINDAEIQILEGNLELYGSDLLDHYKEYPPKKRFMKAWQNVAGDGRTVRLEIADGEVTYINEQGQRESYLHPALFALAGQDDAEAGVNYDLYLGVNRVVHGGRTGSGLSKVKVRWGSASI